MEVAGGVLFPISDDRYLPVKRAVPRCKKNECQGKQELNGFEPKEGALLTSLWQVKRIIMSPSFYVLWPSSVRPNGPPTKKKTKKEEKRAEIRKRNARSGISGCSCDRLFPCVGCENITNFGFAFCPDGQAK